jgi:hypothetical protein
MYDLNIKTAKNVNKKGIPLNAHEAKSLLRRPLQVPGTKKILISIWKFGALNLLLFIK